MNSEQENDIIHRWQNKQSIRSIASQMNLSRFIVSGIIRKHAQQRDVNAAIQNDAPPASLGATPTRRSSKLDAFAVQLEQLLERYPKITATRAMEELQRSGYDGGYRVVDTDGTIQYANNRYSVPWRLVGESLPVRITDELLIVYDRTLGEVARHVVMQGLSGMRRIDPDHMPPRDHEQQMKRLRERYVELGGIGVAYLEGLESKQRNSKHQALKVLGLLHAYHKSDLLRAMERAVQYHAFGFASLERILSHQATPKPSWQQLDETSQDAIKWLAGDEPVGSRHSQEYQGLLYGNSDTIENLNGSHPQENVIETSDNTTDSDDASPIDPEASSNVEDSAE
jgi:hypothetical protein